MARTYRNRKQWLTIVEQFNASSMTVADFCRSHQVSQASFYQWRKQLSKQTQPAANQPLFVDITPAGSKSAPQPSVWDIELDLGQGIALRIRRPC